MAESTQTTDFAALKEKDTGYQLARTDAVTYLNGRKPAVISVARRYHLDIDELSQEGYEILLTCLRDFSPIIKKADGSTVNVQFNTFFGSRLEVRAMEMRNRDPEYQARQAVTENMSEEERSSFREDPPLLVQHLDYEGTLQQSLKNEAANAHGADAESTNFRILQDSFFDKKLTKLVEKETDEKKKAALLHVKAGGIYNFKEIAYQFGVTDSRASQVMNELMDAFYIQRLIDRDLKAVHTDFEKLKFTPKRIERLITNAFEFVNKKRAHEIATHFHTMPQLKKLYVHVQKTIKKQQKPKEEQKTNTHLTPPPHYEQLFTKEEKSLYPLVEISTRPLNALKPLKGGTFRPALTPEFFKEFCATFNPADPQHLALINKDGTIIDGCLRIRAAQEKGQKTFLCFIIDAPQEDLFRLRVMLNNRLHNSKLEMFYAIAALSDFGLSQQKIADILNTGRTNVLVYCKVKEKATPLLRTLFEDGYIQITNAATCADLPEKQQEAIAMFIRRYGKAWSKGKNFSNVYDAVISGRLAGFEKSLPQAVKEQAQTTALMQEEAPPMHHKLEALHKKLKTYEMALKDQEIWAAQREGVINQQREELTALKAEVEALRRQTEVAELIKFTPTQGEEALQQAITALFQVIAARIEHQKNKPNTTEKALKNALVHLQKDLQKIEQLLQK